MFASLFSLVLAILGLSLLIFFHELGHYFMARRVGMRVEVFSIGMGRPIYSWNYQGVKWQICWLLFGGFVKIAGHDQDDKRDPYTIPDGFFGKSPWDRIKVAFAGPAVNIVLAFLIFCLIWISGGREKNFAEFTHKIGWVDPESALYVEGVRPGDEMVAYNLMPYKSAKDHLYVPMITFGDVEVTGLKVNYIDQQDKIFDFFIKPYPHPLALDKDRLTTGIIAPGSYLIYGLLPNRQENPLPNGSPMRSSGIEYGDRIVWLDGNLIFSIQQLSYLLNDKRAFLTVIRDGEIYQLRVPRVPIEEFKLDSATKEELTDWQYHAGLNGTKFAKLYMIPYGLTNDGVVERALKFIDREHEREVFPENLYASNEAPLLPHDRIIAVDGVAVNNASTILGMLQEHRANIIVERNPDLAHSISWEEADADYNRNTSISDIQAIAHAIGTHQPLKMSGQYLLLNPVIPRSRFDFESSPEARSAFLTEVQEQKKEIERMTDPERRAHSLALLKSQEEQLVLGLPVQDRRVEYNPSPITLFREVFTEIFDTIVALFSGALSPKWVSGPIGIVQVVHNNWMLGINEALFWLGAISLNLGMLNLLPIPVLDGGTILLSFIEIVTGKRIPSKTLEKLIVPFAILLIGLFVFLTYQDLGRIFHFFR